MGQVKDFATFQKKEVGFFQGTLLKREKNIRTRAVLHDIVRGIFPHRDLNITQVSLH